MWVFLKFVTNTIRRKVCGKVQIDRSHVNTYRYHSVISLYKCVQWNTQKGHRLVIVNFQVTENLFPNCWQSYHRCVARYLAFSINSVPQRSRKNEGSIAAARVHASRDQRVNNCDDSSITPYSYYSYVTTIKLILAGRLTQVMVYRLNSI